MTVDKWLDQNVAKLIKAEIKSARLDCLILLESVTTKDRAWLLANPKHRLTDKQCVSLEELVIRRQAREPMAYILGKKEFYGLEFMVSPDVLIPRPETEDLVTEAIKSIPKSAHVLELGTGSGCISVSLKYHRQDLEITAADISRPALKVAQKNAKKLYCSIKFVQSDMFNNIRSKYDVVLANLPYVPSGSRHEPELNYEPREALFAGVKGLKFYRIFFEQLSNHLSSGGFALIEASAVQFKELGHIATKNSYIINYITNYIIKIEQQISS